ncbi:nitroreductase family protein [Bifidobacterium sp. 64T4]|uniref:nitroreductase family protein n=1 Tax=Bifidobacterium pongonis TaxID=2834432 RepID=UPI001C59A446|nr:nitroreductase family protein [Bifidobacterium pongonis]MBW3095525.1 nitroreductase family protein [Bifidobacterium pongonis]
MNWKKIAEKCTPKPLMVLLKNVRQSIYLYRDSWRQARRFNRSYSRVMPRERVRLDTRVMFLSHQIEKGLSHRNFRYGFGKKVFNELPQLLTRLEQVDPEFASNTVYKESLAALHEYMQRHLDAGKDVSWQKSLFTTDQWRRIMEAKSDDGGSIVIRKIDKSGNKDLSYVALSEMRHSVREFADEAVSLDEIRQAIQLAMRTPSVCNRQPTRVHVILDKEIIAEALRIQGGVNGYPIPPALLMITADLRAFITSYERNEGYTDGGLFGMSLLLSLEYMGIGACPLNTMFTAVAERKTRKLLRLPDNEVPVMYIEVGHFLDETRTCHSARFNGEDITSVLQ